MPAIELPDGTTLDVTPPTQAEQEIIGSLHALVRLIDTLVGLECGLVKRADLKREILAAREEYAKMVAERESVVPTAEEALAAVPDEGGTT
jgi:hypothetical protein